MKCTRSYQKCYASFAQAKRSQASLSHSHSLTVTRDDVPCPLRTHVAAGTRFLPPALNLRQAHVPTTHTAPRHATRPTGRATGRSNRSQTSHVTHQAHTHAFGEGSFAQAAHGVRCRCQRPCVGLVSGGGQKVANSHQTIGVRHRGPSDLKGPKNAPGVPRTHHPQAHAKKSDATALCCVSCAAAK